MTRARRACPLALGAALAGSVATASAAPPTPGIGKTLRGSTEAGKPAETPALGPRPWLPTTTLQGAGGLVELCDALRSEDRMTFTGNPVEQARAREDHRKRRVAAAAANYVVDISDKGFWFRSYDLPNQRLVLDGDKGFVLADGHQISGRVPDGDMDYELGPDPAEAILKAQASGKLSLRLVFRPAKPEIAQSACVRPAGGGVAKLHAQVLSFDLVRPDGSVAARGDTADYADAAATANRVAEPIVAVRRPSADVGNVPEDIVDAVQALGPPILPCYQKALASHPGLRGTLVVELRLAPDGSIQQPKMQVSSLGDDALVGCALGKIGKTKLAHRPAAAMRMSVPIGFGGKGE